MCDFCEDHKVVTISSCVGIFELETYGRELEINYFCNDQNYDCCKRLTIEYCPFCGKKLKED